MLEGLRTIVYQVSDLAEAKAWYAKVLNLQPYFDQPFYVGFNVGGYELGLDPARTERERVAGTSVTYWGVANVDAALKRLLELGAAPHAGIQDVGEGIRLASVFDPFGNVLGIIENPHFSIPGK